MEKRHIVKVLTWSTAALILPILGQLFVRDWNWSVGDFVFAWVFFNILGLAYVFVTSRIAHRGRRIAAGIAVVVLFVLIWAGLATG